MNIDVHHKDKYWSLGLVKILGSLYSTKIVKIVTERLANFGLDFDDYIVGSTTDGASVMVRFGKEILV